MDEMGNKDGWEEDGKYNNTMIKRLPKTKVQREGKKMGERRCSLTKGSGYTSARTRGLPFFFVAGISLACLMVKDGGLKSHVQSFKVLEH
jgi:hypothetical protein